jgi:hypothetical protein
VKKQGFSKTQFVSNFTYINPFMKKTFLTLLFFSGFLISTCLAQTNQGSVLLGGSINFSSYNESRKDDFHSIESKTTNFNISPTVGYFVANRVAVGSSVGYIYSLSKYNSDMLVRGMGFSVAPFVRYYKLLGDKAAIFGSASVNYARYTAKGSNVHQDFTKTPYKRTDTDYGAAFTPGLTYFVSSKIGLEATLGSIGFGKEQVNYQDGNYHTESTSTDFRAQFGLSHSSIGIYFYLNR